MLTMHLRSHSTTSNVHPDLAPEFRFEDGGAGRVAKKVSCGHELRDSLQPVRV
jgi:hypothetical protein